MGQPKTPGKTIQLFHVNFHTVRNLPVFEVPEYDALARPELKRQLAKWHIICLAWEVMPTHVHLVLLTFPDVPMGRAMRLIKGGVSHAVLAQAPELRADLGDHLWQEGYHWVEVTSHEQCLNAIRYVRENRRRGGLEDDARGTALGTEVPEDGDGD
jgi:REP element-mobilizing transposase RayT